METEINNVLSIYSRKIPCESLFMTREEFNEFYSSCLEEGKQTHDSHIDTCTDCSQRHYVENRETMDNRIKMFLKALSEGLENPNA